MQLSAEEQYAAIELFRGTMVRHNVIIYPNERPGHGQPIRFDDGRWQNFVPLRLPQTLCIEERLPPGATAVLLNQSHTDADLVLPIDETQKQLFEGIDGQCTIAEILKSLPGGDRSKHHQEARAFFEHLWWYDQVVFDTSQALSGHEPKLDGDKRL
jgi:hypothetical protein